MIMMIFGSRIQDLEQTEQKGLGGGQPRATVHLHRRSVSGERTNLPLLISLYLMDCSNSSAYHLLFVGYEEKELVEINFRILKLIELF